MRQLQPGIKSRKTHAGSESLLLEGPAAACIDERRKAISPGDTA